MDYDFLDSKFLARPPTVPVRWRNNIQKRLHCLCGKVPPGPNQKKQTRGDGMQGKALHCYQISCRDTPTRLGLNTNHGILTNMPRPETPHSLVGPLCRLVAALLRSMRSVGSIGGDFLSILCRSSPAAPPKIFADLIRLSSVKTVNVYSTTGN